MQKIKYLMLAFCFLCLRGYAQLGDLTTIQVPDPNHAGSNIECGSEGSELSDRRELKAHLAWLGNPKKNRFDIPDDHAITVLDINDLIASDADKTKFTEGVAVQITGYVDTVKSGDPESCNCGTKDVAYKDTHIELTPNSSKTDKKYIVIVEITPRMRELMKEKGEDWSTKAIKQKYLHHMVTVQGWLFYDEEHEAESFATNPANTPNSTGRKPDWRASCWEIHPITSIK